MADKPKPTADAAAKAKALAAAKADWKRQVAANGRKPTIEDYSREGERPGSRLKVGKNIGGRVWTDTRGSSYGDAPHAPAPKPGPATEIQRATDEARSRYGGKDKVLRDKYDTPLQNLNGDRKKLDAAREQNRKNMAQESRLTAQARSYEIAQRKAKIAKAQPAIDAALKKAAGK